LKKSVANNYFKIINRIITLLYGEFFNFIHSPYELTIMERFFSLISLATTLFSSCQKGIEGGIVVPPVVISDTTILNVAYGSDAKQKMDVYLPAGRTTSTTRVMILIHGGAWATGDKNDFSPYVDSLNDRLPGWAIFNINYRLSNGVVNLFPTQEMDVKSAYEFIYNKRAEYKISDKFVILGASAGAHLALLQGYKNTSPVKPKAIVDFFGPTDMKEMYDHPASATIPPAVLAQVVGGTPTSNATLYQQSSPINYATTQSPPTIILQGGMDPLVAVTQSTTLDTKLQSLGVVHQYVFYPTEGHGWFDANLSDSFDKIGLFLAANVQ